jgi:Phytanoyl-CoA dioxygenase (PhyH)
MIGTLVIIHGNVLHKSEANRSLKSRYIYTFHVIEGEAEYDEKNWFVNLISSLTLGCNQRTRASLKFIDY